MACKVMKPKVDQNQNEPTLEDRIWYTLLLI
jgi:hypothetical protein